jgi:hypothetical protein
VEKPPVKSILSSLPAERKLCVGLYGMPRSGSTIIASFFNSIDRSFCLSEPFRSRVMLKLDTEFGPIVIRPKSKIMDIVSFVQQHEPRIYGWKEVYNRGVPGQFWRIMSETLPLLDTRVAVIRDPRRAYASHVALATGGDAWPAREWQAAYLSVYHTLLHFNFRFLLFERFLSNPIDHVNETLGLGLYGVPGLVPNQLKGGDVGGMESARIRKEDIRPPYQGDGIEQAESLYREIATGAW